MSVIAFAFIQLLVSPLFAATLETPIREGDHLALKGLDAQVQFTVQPNATALRIIGPEVSGSEGQFVVTRKDNLIEVKMVEFDSKKTWMSALPKANSYMKKIEIVGPSIPAEVHLKNGSVNVQKWSKDLKISLTQGKVTAINGAGNLQVYLQKGDINVQDHLGKVLADTYVGAINLKNINGDVEASLFSGNLILEKVKGFINLTTQQAAGKLIQSAGTVQFENGKGSLVIQNFQGRVEGESQDGAVNVGVALDSEVDIKSKAGRVTVQLPPGSGANVNLHTVDGEIVVPGELKVNRLSSEKNVRGRLRGESQRGSVLVRSQEGTILLK
jgi:DUF4097 and DUF4098 domain-containing protein YvlB